MENYKLYLRKIINNEKLTIIEIQDILNKITYLFIKEPLSMEIKSPCYVIGDIHGQFYDLLNIFKIMKDDQIKRGLFNSNSKEEGDSKKNDFTDIDDFFINTNIICLGDYVDRGYHSVETLLFLFLYKILYRNLYILRGNHESKLLNGVYGFKKETTHKYSSFLFEKFMSVFDLMSMFAIVDSRYFLVHGGLGIIDYNEIEKIYQCSLITKHQEDKDIGDTNAQSMIVSKLDALKSYFSRSDPNKFIDFLWSDPCDEGFSINTRGLGYLFGKDTVEKFLSYFDLRKIIRSHQLVMEGYKEEFDGTLITIWSAPNYCYRMGNVGCVLYIDKVFEFITFNKVENQY